MPLPCPYPNTAHLRPCHPVHLAAPRGTLPYLPAPFLVPHLAAAHTWPCNAVCWGLVEDAPRPEDPMPPSCCVSPGLRDPQSPRVLQYPLGPQGVVTQYPCVSQVQAMQAVQEMQAMQEMQARKARNMQGMQATHAPQASPGMSRMSTRPMPATTPESPRGRQQLPREILARGQGESFVGVYPAFLYRHPSVQCRHHQRQNRPTLLFAWIVKPDGRDTAVLGPCWGCWVGQTRCSVSGTELVFTQRTTGCFVQDISRHGHRPAASSGESQKNGFANRNLQAHDVPLQEKYRFPTTRATASTLATTRATGPSALIAPARPCSTPITSTLHAAIPPATTSPKGPVNQHTQYQNEYAYWTWLSQQHGPRPIVRNTDHPRTAPPGTVRQEPRSEEARLPQTQPASPSETTWRQAAPQSLVTAERKPESAHGEIALLTQGEHVVKRKNAQLADALRLAWERGLEPLVKAHQLSEETDQARSEGRQWKRVFRELEDEAARCDGERGKRRGDSEHRKRLRER